MNPGLRIAIPAVIILSMVVVGLALTPADFRRVARHPKAVFAGLVGQATLLPLLAVALLKIFDPAFEIVVGMLLIVACPAGGITNYLAYLARANTALSVTLTAVGTALALLTMPLILAATFTFFPAARAEIQIPIGQTAVQLVVLILLPVGIGMLIRFWKEALVLAFEPRLRSLSLVSFLGVVAWVLYDQAQGLKAGLGEVFLISVLFTAFAMFTGYLVGRWCGLDANDRLTLITEYSGRNLGVAVVIAVSILGRVEFLVFASILFVVSVLLVLLVIAVFRAEKASASTLR